MLLLASIPFLTPVYKIKRETNGFYFDLVIEGENIPSDFEKKLYAHELVIRHLLMVTKPAKIKKGKSAGAKAIADKEGSEVVKKEMKAAEVKGEKKSAKKETKEAEAPVEKPKRERKKKTE